MKTSQNLNTFFNPQSVVIIGASETSGKIGNDLMKNLESFKGEIFGVNPKGGNFKNIEFYSEISALPKTPDIAVIAIPARFVEKSLEECGEKGIKNVIIISAGFKESGNISGEKNIQEISGKFGINILGPNCLGMINTHQNLNLSFAGKIPEKGNIALVSQSGAMATALMDFAESRNLGFSKIISMGNKAGLHENNFLDFLENDDETEVIVLYIEDIVSGREFYETCKRITPKKPIIVVKSGVSEKGALAAASHTGALSGEKVILETAFKQAGVNYTHSLEDLFLWSKFFSKVRKNDVQDDLILVTNAGGPGVMAIDNAERFGVSLAEFSEKEQNILKENMPDASSMKNPVDILGDAASSRYKQILENITKLQKKRNILVMLTHQTTTDTENIAKEISKFYEKNPEILVMTSFMGGSSVEEGRKILREFSRKNTKNFLHFDFPKEGLKALAQFQKWKKIHPENSVGADIIRQKNIGNSHGCSLQGENTKGDHKGTPLLISPEKISALFKKYEIPFLEETLLKTPEEAMQKFSEISENGKFSVVMKIVSPDIPHKTDCGGVRLNIKTQEDAQKIFSEIVESSSKANPNAEILGVSMQKMMASSREVFVGMTLDKTFGEVLLFGLGGIFVNVFEDISRRLAPIDRSELQKMMREIKSLEILKGTRGEKSIDFELLENVILKIMQLFHENPEIQDIDLNPIFAREDGAWLVDAKIFVR